MSDLAAAVFVITGLTASWAYLTWWILKPPKQEPQICDFCDIEGPHILGERGHAQLDLHRALHQLGRTITQEIARRLPRSPQDDEQDTT